MTLLEAAPTVFPHPLKEQKVCFHKLNFKNFAEPPILLLFWMVFFGIIYGKMPPKIFHFHQYILEICK